MSDKRGPWDQPETPAPPKAPPPIEPVAAHRVWLWLAVLGVVGPALILIWGWM